MSVLAVVTRIVPASDGGLGEAVALLERGALVAFPTETVYGLGGLALDPAAVRAIFEAKGRPASNPVIVHVLDLDGVAGLVTAVPPLAVTLARAFWPGPLTLVLPRAPGVPDEVTAGGSTVALRAPAHPVARALLAALGKPLAAPSANRSSEVSPTTAEHVLASLGGRIPLILDGGPCAVGIESTVLDVTGAIPVLLRPGSIPREAIAAVLGVEPALPSAVSEGPLRSPGLLTRHYAPRARVALAPGSRVAEERARFAAQGLRVGVLAAGQPRGEGVVLPADPDGYARGLYAALRDLDAGHDALVIELPGEGPRWEAILDRLRRAASSA